MTTQVQIVNKGPQKVAVKTTVKNGEGHNVAYSEPMVLVEGQEVVLTVWAHQGLDISEVKE